MIHRLSHSMANWLAKHAPGQGHPVAVVAYGIEIFLMSVIQLLLILLVAAWLGLFVPVVAAFLAFALLRMFSGGKHLSAFWSCTLSDIVLLCGLAWLAQRITLMPWYIHGPLLAGAVIAAWFSVRRYAPLITVRRPTGHLQVHGRTYSLAFVLAATAVAAALYRFDPALTGAIVFGMAAQGLSITPVGCKAVDRLDRWLSSYSFHFNTKN